MASPGSPLPAGNRGIGPGVWIDLALLIALVCAGAFLRLQMLESAVISSDAISPYLKSYQILSGRRLHPYGPFPESGYLVGWMFLPYLLSADSLLEAFRTRFLWNALAPVPIYLALRMCPPPGGTPLAAPLQAPQMTPPLTPKRSTGRLAAWVGASVMALSPGLADTLLTGYQTFDAPLYATLPTWGALWWFFRQDPRAAWLAIPALPVIAMLHPFSIVYAVAGILVVGDMLRRGHWRPLLLPILLAALVALPQAVRYGASGTPDRSATSQLWSIATGAGQMQSLAHDLKRAVHEELLDREPVGHAVLLLSPALVALTLRMTRRKRASPTASAGLDAPGSEAETWRCSIQATLAWLALLCGSMMAIAAWIRYFQHYHLRLLLPGLAVSVGLWTLMLEHALRERLTAERGGTWLPALPGLGLAGLLAWSLGLHHYPPPPSSWDTLGGLDRQLEEVLSHAHTQPGRVAFLSAHLSNQLRGAVGAQMLEAVLRGLPEERLLDHPDQAGSALFYLTVTGPPEHLATACLPEAAGEGSALILLNPAEEQCVLAVRGVARLRHWRNTVCRQLPGGTPLRAEGGTDYLRMLNPGFPTPTLGEWLGSCPAGGLPALPVP